MAPDTTTVVARTADRFERTRSPGATTSSRTSSYSRDVLDDLYPNGHSNTGYISAKLAGGVDPVQLYAISFDPSHEPTTYQERRRRTFA